MNYSQKYFVIMGIIFLFMSGFMILAGIMTHSAPPPATYPLLGMMIMSFCLSYLHPQFKEKMSEWSSFVIKECSWPFCINSILSSFLYRLKLKNTYTICYWTIEHTNGTYDEYSFHLICCFVEKILRWKRERKINICKWCMLLALGLYYF